MVGVPYFLAFDNMVFPQAYVFGIGVIVLGNKKNELIIQVNKTKSYFVGPLWLICFEVNLLKYKINYFHFISGKRCELEVSSDLCDNKPCQNGGTCHLISAGYRYECFCPPGTYRN